MDIEAHKFTRKYSCSHWANDAATDKSTVGFATADFDEKTHFIPNSDVILTRSYR